MSRSKTWLIGGTLWLSLVGVIIAVALMPATTHTPVTLPNYDYPTSHVIVFFGFPTCNGACPMTLSYLSKLQQDWHDPKIKMPQVLFINIDKDSTAYASMEYAQAYNASFIGHMPSAKEFSQYKSDFGLNIQRLKNDISHMARSYLVKREQESWMVIKAYNPNEFTLSQLKTDLQNLEP
jgi:cytochrome oxidase Cu insertion factor (SCO1/SenC/PrrC family)